jgi:hypothetical protein
LAFSGHNCSLEIVVLPWAKRLFLLKIYIRLHVDKFELLNFSQAKGLEQLKKHKCIKESPILRIVK